MIMNCRKTGDNEDKRRRFVVELNAHANSLMLCAFRYKYFIYLYNSRDVGAMRDYNCIKINTLGFFFRLFGVPISCVGLVFNLVIQFILLAIVILAHLPEIREKNK